MHKLLLLAAAISTSAPAWAISEDNYAQVYDQVVEPGVVDGQRQGQFTGRNGVPISFIHLPAVQERGAIVFVHGRGASHMQAHELFHDLRAQGWSIYSMDPRGQGMSGRMLENRFKGHVEDFQYYVDDLQTFMTLVVKQQPHERLFLMGLSMGGAISTLFAEQHPQGLTGLILMVPMHEPNYAPFDENIASVLGFVGTSTGNAEEYAPTQGDPGEPDPFENPDGNRSEARWTRQRKIQQDTPQTVLGGVTYGWGHEVVKGTRRMRQDAWMLEMPVLLFQAEKDQTVMNRSQDQVCQAAQDCTKVQLANAAHGLLEMNDGIRNVMMKDLFTFLDAHASTPASCACAAPSSSLPVAWAGLLLGAFLARRRRKTITAALLALGTLAGCTQAAPGGEDAGTTGTRRDAGGTQQGTSSSAGTASSGAGSSSSTTMVVDGGLGGDGGMECDPGVLGAPDRARVVLMAFHFGANGEQHVGTVRSFTLSPSGALSEDGTTLELDEAVTRFAFVPAGNVALAIGEDGRVTGLRVKGVANIEPAGHVDLPSADYTDVVMDLDGRRAFVVGFNSTAESGVQVVDIACDGTPTYRPELSYSLRLSNSLARLGTTNRFVLLGGQAVFEPLDARDIRLLEWHPATGMSEVGAFDVFTDFVGTGRLAASPVGDMVVMPNDSVFSDEANQVAVLGVAGNVVSQTERLMDVESPSEALFSPDGATVVVSQLERGRLQAYSRSGTQLVAGNFVGSVGLASQMALISRGPLSGLILVPSVDANGAGNVARVRITAAGQLMDDGQFELGAGNQNSPDAIAVTP